MKKKCNAPIRSNHECSLPAGYRTVHPGVGRCKFHQDTYPLFPYKYSSKKIRGGYGLCKSYRELRIYKYLDRCDHIGSYSIEPCEIEYIFQRETRIYMPDILIQYSDGIKKLVEIKASHDFDNSQNIEKYKAAELYLKTHGDINEFVVWVVELMKGSSKCITNKEYTLRELSLHEVFQINEEKMERARRFLQI